MTDNEVNIPNYSVIRKDRKRDGGGVCIYIHSDLAFNPRPDLDIPKMEAIWTEILLPRCKPIIVGSCYRPKKHTDFTINLETILSKLPADSEVIVLGDMNMCALRKDNVYKTYANMLRLDGFKQLIHVQLESHQPLNHLLIILFVIMTIRSANMVLLQVGLVIIFLLRGGFKTQPPVDQRFRLVPGGCHCLEQ